MSDNALSIADNRQVLFITTKNLEYIRNKQETEELKARASSLTVLGYKGESYFTRILRLYARLFFMRINDYDLIFIGFAPQLVLPLFYYRFKNKTVIADFFISLYDTVICERKKFRSNGLIAGLISRLDRVTAGKADVLIADTRAHAEYFASRFLVPREKIRILYLKADETVYYPRPRVKDTEFASKYVVLYFGSILPHQGTEIILKTARILQNEKDILFDLIGPVSKMERSVCGNLENIIFTPWLSENELAQRIAAADLCLGDILTRNIQKH